MPYKTWFYSIVLKNVKGLLVYLALFEDIIMTIWRDTPDYFSGLNNNPIGYIV
jgi:hypothetical protein